MSYHVFVIHKTFTNSHHQLYTKGKLPSAFLDFPSQFSIFFLSLVVSIISEAPQNITIKKEK